MRITSKRKQSKIGEVIKNHVNKNLKEYIIVSVLLIIGVILGVMFINNSDNNQISQIENYISDFINILKGNGHIDKQELLKKSIINNVIITFVMWFAGSTVIGIPIVLGIVIFRGFAIGYTISSIVITLGMWKGIAFVITAVLFQNIIVIPAILSLAVTGMKLYKSILKDKRRENIKIELVRHTVVSIIILAILIVSSLIETYISTILLNGIIKYL